MATGGRYPSTKERVNYGRLCRVVVDLSTDVMRKILTKLVVPSQLLIVVQNCSDLRKLAADELQRINQAVAGTTYGKFDISFLYKLIRAIGTQELRYELNNNIPASNILTKMQSTPSLMAQLTRKQSIVLQNATDYSDFDCGLLTLVILTLTSINIPNIIPSANDWGGKTLPNSTNTKLGDDIERIRLIRNNVYGHVSDTCVTDSDFQKYWTELTGIMQRMDQEFSTGGQYLKDLNDILTASLDDKWEIYESTIRELAKQEQEIKDRLEKQEESTQQLQTDVKQMESRLEKQDESTGQLQKDVNQMESRLEKQDESTGQLQKDVNQMESRLEKQDESTGQLQKDVNQIESRLEKQDESTGQLQKDVNQIESRLEKQDESTGQLQKDVNQMESRLEKKDESTGQLQKGVNQIESRLEKQDESTGQLQKDVNQMESRLEKQDESTGQLQKGVSSLNKSIAEMGGKVDVMQTQVASLSLVQDERDRTENTTEISSDKLRGWTEDDETFYETIATKRILEHINKEASKRKRYLIVGLPGAGKTANCHHIALQLNNNGYRLCCVGGIKELIDKTGIFEAGGKQVYVINDVFGVHGVNDETVKEWTEKHKDDIERCLNKPNVILLCSSRVQVVNDKKLSNIIKSYFTVINISEVEGELSSEERSKERVEIFRKHASVKERVDLLKDEVRLREEVEENIQQIECTAGCFPLMCRLYVGDKEIKQTINEYFNKPLDQIQEHIRSLQNSPSDDVKLGYFCLLMCMIYDNKVPVNTMKVGEEEQETKNKRQELLELCELPTSTSRETIRKKMDTLLQTFIKREGDTYQFVHDIIHDAVIKHVNNLSSSIHQVIMSHCSSKFMMDRIHLSGVVCKVTEDFLGFRVTRGHDTESCINIRPDSFICWGVRVLDIVRDGVRTSDQLYNDIDEGRCSIDDDRLWSDNPWRDVFWYNRCVHSTEGQTAIVQALERKSPSDVQTFMCTDGYSLSYNKPRHTALHWSIEYGLTHIVRQTLSMISTTRLRQLDSPDRYGRGLLSWARGPFSNTDIEHMVRQKLQEGQNVTKS